MFLFLMIETAAMMANNQFEILPQSWVIASFLEFLIIFLTIYQVHVVRRADQHMAEEFLLKENGEALSKLQESA